MQPNLINEYFDRWTAGLNGKDRRVRVFEKIRDIKYAIVPEIRNAVDGPEKLLALMRGSCTPKHFLLGRMFGMLDIQIKYYTYPFSWDAPELTYPPKLREIVRQLPIEYHLACKAYIDGKWVIIDATLDPPLKRAGFPINEKWDGQSDTLLAVKPLEEIEHRDDMQRDRFVMNKKTNWSAADQQNMDLFYNTFNQWLEEIRMGVSP